jgi:ribosomal protein L12E/L44/L45/RPP1/RPP2
MPLTNEIKQMQQQGQSDSEIATALKGRGLSDKDISTALSQAEIKQAVSPPQEAPQQAAQAAQTQQETPQPVQTQQISQAQPEMQPSMLDGPSSETNQPQQTQPKAQQQYEPPTPQQTQQYAQQSYDAYPQPPQSAQPQSYDSYQPYQSASGGTSSDVVTEISEQVVAEALGPLKRKLEKNIDLKTSFETKLSNLDDRLKSIEKIIDRLQLSILQKVGESMANIDDIKTELIETQKTIKSHHKSRTHTKKK